MIRTIKVIIILIVISFLVSLNIYSQNKDKIDIKVLEGEKVVFGKWGDRQGEFGIRWDEGIPGGPYIRPVVDKEGFIYVLDAINERVNKFSKDGKFLLSFPFLVSQFNIGGFQIDKKGNIFVGDQIYSTEGKLKERIPKFTEERNTFLLFGINDEGNLLVKDVDRKIQHIISRGGAILKTGEPHQIFTPINGKDYSLSPVPRKGPDRKDFILKIYDSRSREKPREISFLFEDSLINRVSLRKLIPIRISKNGYIIVVGKRRIANFDYVLFYIDTNKGKIEKAFVLASEKLVTTNYPPIFGIDGNLYQSGFSADLDDPSAGGFWVKRYIVPDEDKPR